MVRKEIKNLQTTIKTLGGVDELTSDQEQMLRDQFGNDSFDTAVKNIKHDLLSDDCVDEISEHLDRIEEIAERYSSKGLPVYLKLKFNGDGERTQRKIRAGESSTTRRTTSPFQENDSSKDFFWIINGKKMGYHSFTGAVQRINQSTSISASGQFGKSATKLGEMCDKNGSLELVDKKGNEYEVFPADQIDA